MKGPALTAYSALWQVLDSEWRTARELADLSGIPRRSAGQRLGRMVRERLVEERRVGSAPSPRSDAPPREYRRPA